MKKTLLLLFILILNIHLYSQNEEKKEAIPPIDISGEADMSNIELKWTHPFDFEKWQEREISLAGDLATVAFSNVAVLFDYRKMGYTFSFPCKIKKISQVFANFGEEPGNIKFKIYNSDFTEEIASTENVVVDTDVSQIATYEFSEPIEVTEPFKVVVDIENTSPLYPILSTVGDFGSHSYFMEGGVWKSDEEYEVMMSVTLVNSEGEERTVGNTESILNSLDINLPANRLDEIRNQERKSTLTTLSPSEIIETNESLSGFKIYLDDSETPYAEINDPQAKSYTLENVELGQHSIRMSSVYGSTESPLSNKIIVLSDKYCKASAEKIDEYFTDIEIAGSSFKNTNAKNTYINEGINGNTIELNRNQKYTVKLTNAKHYLEDKMGMWIDWNKDGDFEDLKEKIRIYYNTSTSIAQGEFTVPSDAKRNTTRIRLRVTSGSNVESCGVVEWGQVIDLFAEIEENPKPIIEPLADRVGVSEEISFKDISINARQKWIWNFGEDATPSTLEMTKDDYKEVVSVTYSSVGEKTVSLKVDDKDETFECKINVVAGSADVAAPSYLNSYAHANSITLDWIKSGETPTLNKIESFEGAFPPSGWAVEESNSLFTGFINTYSPINWEQVNGDYKPEFSMRSKHAAYIDNTATNYKWLITPEVNIKEGDLLKFWMAFTNYSGSLGSSYCKFSIMVEENRSWKELKQFGKKSKSNVFEEAIKIDLKDYVGKNIRVGFVYKSFGHSLSIDDVAIINTNDENTRDDLVYLVYRNNEKVAEVVGTKNTFTEELTEEGEFTYYITAKKDDKESYPSNEVEVRSALPIDLPYTEDFEDMSDISCNNDSEWKFGTTSELSSPNASFEGNTTTFAGVNSETSENRVTSYISVPPLNLGEYGYLNFSFKYKFIRKRIDSKFILKYRTSPKELWKKIRSLPISNEWRDYVITLPKEALVDRVELAFFYTDGKMKDFGAGIDDIKIDFISGKNFVVKDDVNKTLEVNSTINIGRVKEGAHRDYYYTVYNTGTEDIEISSVKLSNETDFSIQDNPQQLIKKGESAKLTIRYQPSGEGQHTTDVMFTSDKDPENEIKYFTLNGEQGEAEWTWMLYLYEDGTGLNGFKDFNELEANGSIPGMLNYIVLYDADDDEKDGIYYIKRDPDGANEAIVSKKISAHMNSGLNMNNWETLRDFTVWTQNEYPANKYALTVWDHGSGIFRSHPAEFKAAIGTMTLWEMNDALSEFKKAANKKFEIVGFDVCLMGQVETAYQLKDNASFITASEKTEPNDGWDYVNAFKNLTSDPVNTTSEQICDDIVTTYIDSYKPGGSAYEAVATQAAVSIEKMNSELIPAINDFALALAKELPENKTKIANAVALTYNSEQNVEHKDLAGFADNIAVIFPTGELHTAAKAVMDAVDEAVIAEGHTSTLEGVHGLKIWLTDKFENSLNKQYYINDIDYLTFGNTCWDEFLRQFQNPVAYGTLTADFDADYTTVLINNSVNFENRTKANPFTDTYEWKITPETGWNFIDGTSATSIHPRVKFIKVGKYSISLSASLDGKEKTTDKKDYITVKLPTFDAPGYLKATVKEDGISLKWLAPNQEPGTLITWKGYTNLDKSNNLALFKETATLFSNSDLGYTYPARIRKLSYAFFDMKNGENDWTNDIFRFKVYNADMSEVLYESANIRAESNVEVIYTLPEELVVNQDFIVTTVRDAEDFSPHSLFTQIDENEGHSFVYKADEDKWYKASSNGKDWEFPARVYLAYSDVNSNSERVVQSVEYKPIGNSEDRVVVLSDKPINTNYRGDGQHVGYKIYRNGELLKTLNNETISTYFDNISEDGKYTYHITALYENPKGESGASNKIDVDFKVGVNELEGSGINIYPNPVKGDFTIELPNLQEEILIQIFNADGSLVDSRFVSKNSKSVRIDDIKLDTGVYMLQLKSKSWNAVDKIVVE
ncbi:MAG: clostripain-related cysteine peptidase [Hyphomicrobiales bacterium]